MNYIPLHTKIIVKRVAPELTSIGGIVLARSEEPDRAEIVAVAPAVTEVKIGDVCLVNWNMSAKIDKENYSMDIENVIAVYED
jgi:co-chaperonin GroES (HSP10)